MPALRPNPLPILICAAVMAGTASCKKGERAQPEAKTEPAPAPEKAEPAEPYPADQAAAYGVTFETSPTRPKGESTPENEIQAKPGEALVRWNVKHNCGLRPKVTERYRPGFVELDVSYSGKERDCADVSAMFATIVRGLPGGQLRVSGPGLAERIDVPQPET